jgi:sigma-B regulation protein RsbU (phosphoserine phosphatase)
MLQRSARFQYALLALVAIVALIHFYMGAAKSFENLAHGQERARVPFFIGSVGHVVRLTTPEAIDAGRRPADKAITVTFALPEAERAGLHVGDAVLSINGRPFTGTTVLIDEIQHRRPGETLSLITLRPDGSETRLALKLAPDRSMPTPLWAWVLQSCFMLIPFFGLLIGLYVVFARPRNPHAWLILGVLAYFDALFIPANLLHGRLHFVAVLWNTIAQTAMPLCLMLFGIYFPERSRIDIRYPWIKWVILVPILALFPTDLIYDYGHNYNFNAEAWLFPWLDRISYVENILGMFAIGYFFACIATKVSTATGDARRRLKVLYIGTAVGLTPVFILVIIALIRHADLGQNMPRWITLPSFAILMLFPLTLAYVVVVQRAMDVRILIRQGTKYFFARSTVAIILVLLSIWMTMSLIHFIRYPHQQRAVDIVRVFGIIALFFGFRFGLSKRLQQKIDQRFFREAYSTEQVLSELSDEARNFTEVTPLLTTVTQRISDTLHIDRIAVFLRAGETYRLHFATGAPLTRGALALPAASTTITTLTRGRGPATVYRDDPSSWLIEASDSERSALADLSTELLVPLPGRNRLAGVMALGPKRSQEPYSRTDRQLLQSVASQTGLALENAELFENLTAEVSHRERISREIEIAREVQEHLFPQVVPSIPGIDIAGYCRPAQAVGGDYYDFFILPGTNGDQRLALALGDISGKGISAALLMASLRASLRSAAQIQPGDLPMLMRHVNRLVYESSTANRYATFFYAELDPCSRLLSYVNAGHNPPIILRGSETIPLESTGTVIGLLPDVSFLRASILLRPGDVLITFTDGISEAMNAAEEEWGESSMIAAARSLLSRPNCKTTARQLLDCIFNEADRFTAGASQHDDMTLLVCVVN